MNKDDKNGIELVMSSLKSSYELTEFVNSTEIIDYMYQKDYSYTIKTTGHPLMDVTFFKGKEGRSYTFVTNVFTNKQYFMLL